jgi:ribose-phosphate pyrophosphokinase
MSPDACPMPGACLLYFEDEQAQATRLAQAAGLPERAVERHRFPDGELRLRLPVDAAGALPPQAVLLRSLHQPNEKLVELLLAARTARALGVRHLTLVAPYLGYMRQDMAFEPGQVVSQQVVGGFLASLFDAVITVDPHLHRVSTLAQAVPVRQAVALSGAEPLADLIAQRRPAALLVGPDGESAQWIVQAAARHGFDHAVCTKVRRGDRDVAIKLPALNARGRAVVLLDDMASTGRTLALAAQLLRQAGAASVDVAVTHALFAGDALQALHDAGVGEVWSTDCIAHASNAVPMAPLLGQAVRAVLHAAR